MSKYKEAIEAIKANYPTENYTILREGLDLAMEVLEKQISKAVIPYNSAKNHNFIECSVCSGHLNKYYKYCTECGQKLRD